MSDATALAVFVKTPGVSPVKTRLAKSIGRERAEEFFRLSIGAVEATMTEVAHDGRVQPYWAVAEKAALCLPIWQAHANLAQGTGELGDRIEQVFHALHGQHGRVLAMGADSPQLTSAAIRAAVDHLNDDHDDGPSHVLGRCHDGGFYLVGTRQQLPAGTWQGIRYSACTTAEQVAQRLAPLGTVHELPRLTDVDEVADLKRLQAEFQACNHWSLAQGELRHWIDRLLGA